MGNGNYVLDRNGNHIEEPDIVKYALWWSTERKKWHFKTRIGNRLISTVFLGLDHNFFSDGPVILWETMVFGGDDGEECERTSTITNARLMHNQMIENIRFDLGRTGFVDRCVDGLMTLFYNRRP